MASSDEQLVASIGLKFRDYPDNICLNTFDLTYYNALSEADQKDFVQCIRSGVENADSSMGCYACQPSDFERFKPFFSKVLAAYHEVDEGQRHVSSADWSVEGIDGVPAGGVLDVAEFGVSDMSMRVRVARNLEGFALPAAMSRDERCALEDRALESFEKLMAMPRFGGR